ncbi:MAG: Hsp20/alpha crystallin family protein [Eubacteriaceae bacterium]|jgi:HSP20 family molecular chaperone IbpA|nr:Hsp20/alpha crystallin family protein [Eubacteriaceae bacterium]
MLFPTTRSFMNVFDNFFSEPFFTKASETKVPMVMKTDIKEAEDHYLIDVDMPGYNKDDIKIELSDGYLKISGERQYEKKEDKDNYIHRERYTGQCSRSFYVGDDLTEEDVKAAFKDGILSLTLPKKEKEEKLPEKKYIAIEG